MNISAVSDYFLDYIQGNGIIKVDSFNGFNAKGMYLDEGKIDKHLHTISDFHKKVLGFNNHTAKRLKSSTGKSIEQYKMSLKKLKRDIKNISVNSPSNPFEELLLKKGEEYACRAEKCICEIYKSGYLNIIERSMKRNEICLGDTDFANLREDQFIEVVDVSKCSYNMFEIDGTYLIGKLKRKGKALDYKALVNKFCLYEGLDENSVNLMVALISYPHQFMKCCDRYRSKKKNWTSNIYKQKLEQAILQDGDSLI